jgi:molybdopterin converting factor subunit 1
MRLSLALFAMLKDEIGPVFEIEVPDAADVATLKRSLSPAHPAFARLSGRLLVAVNESYAADSDVLAEGDAVAILPPIAGG